MDGCGGGCGAADDGALEKVTPPKTLILHVRLPDSGYKFPDYMPSKMLFSGCTGKTLPGLRPRRRGHIGASSEVTLVFAAAMVNPSCRTFDSAGAMIVLIGLALYAAVGVAVAGAFVVFGVTRVLPEPVAGDGRRTDSDFSRRRRALALRAHPLAEIATMRRSHRSVHRVLWPVLALAVALGLAMALVLRPPPDADAPQAAEGLKP